jgi:hypothetical protein
MFRLTRRIAIAVAFLVELVPAFAQVPAPVPALPDAERRTSYSITASQCSCTVNFALFGDSTDFANWIEVYLNGVRVNFNDATFGWTITSPSPGTLANLPRPITDAVLTFTNAQTGTVQIVGARRPRRTSQFNENTGIPARNVNQVVTDITATLREMWDKTNDMTGRGLFSQPGNTMGLLPLPAVCSNAFLGFDATGLNPTCVQISTGTSIITPGSVVNGDFVIWSGTGGKTLADGGSFASPPAIGGTAPNAGSFTTLSAIGNSTVGGSETVSGTSNLNGDTYFSGRPWFDVKSTAHSCAAAVGNGSTDDSSAIQCHINFMNTTFGGGIVFFPPGNYHVASTVVSTKGVWLEGAGQDASLITVSADLNPLLFAINATSTNCPVGGQEGGMEKMQINGFNNVSSGTPAVKIGGACNVIIRDSKLLFGAQGLFNAGVDSYIENNFIWGATTALFSTGANWYIRNKFDQAGTPAATNFAYQQGAPDPANAGVIENHFVHCDFSGTYTASVNISDGNGANAITTFDGSVFSSPINIVQAKATMFTGDEFGSTSFNVSSGVLTVVGSFGFSAITVTGAGGRSCAGNINVTC